MEEVWYRPLVWMDYRLAVLFTVVLPVVILAWASIEKAEAIQRLLIIYWRVASLLMITVYLMIPSWPIAFLTGLAARVLIPLCLWFWVDLNDEIADMPKSKLKRYTSAWRWAATVYCGLGALVNLTTIPCAFTENVANTPACRVWLEVPWLYKEILHTNWRPGFIGFLGMTGLVVYILYLTYFLFVRLGKQGRSALEQ